MTSRAVVIHPRGKKTGLFWVTPDAPQSRLFRELGDDQEIVCLRAPAPDSERSPPTLLELARYYTETVGAFSRGGPITLVGYCIAAVLAREVAIQLSAKGYAVRPVIMIDPPDPAKSRLRLQPDPIGYRLAQQGRRLRFHLGQLSTRAPREIVNYLKESAYGAVARRDYQSSREAYAAARSGGAPLSTDFADSYHVAVAAFLNSEPAPYNGRALLIRPMNVPQHAFRFADLRWRELIGGELKFLEVPGNSSSMWQEPAMRFLWKAIQTGLE